MSTPALERLFRRILFPQADERALEELAVEAGIIQLKAV
jgi:hypothetical protein